MASTVAEQRCSGLKSLLQDSMVLRITEWERDTLVDTGTAVDAHRPHQANGVITRTSINPYFRLLPLRTTSFFSAGIGERDRDLDLDLPRCAASVCGQIDDEPAGCC